MAELEIYHRNLPHWRLEGATYFVTWRIGRASDDELSPADRDIVLSTIVRFDGQRYQLLATVVMNDHVHVVVRPHPSAQLHRLVRAWKSVSAILVNRRRSRAGPLWQEESFDRILRTADEVLSKIEYVARNPQKRWPHRREAYPWIVVRPLTERSGSEDPPPPE